jgi:hypothetical protein
MTVADAMLLALATYSAIGLAFAIPFVALWVQRMDTAATGSPVVFRLLILPGSAALWPVLLLRLLRVGVSRPPEIEA